MISEPTVPPARVVVGTDGSESATAAVRWAAEAAARRHLGLHIVYAFDALSNYFAAESGASVSLLDDHEREATRVLDAAVQDACEVDIVLTITTDQQLRPPKPLLVELSRHTHMLVLGASGAVGLAGMFVGSTAVEVASHAYCPVAIIRTRDGAPDPPSTGPVVVGIDGSPTSERAIATAFDTAARRPAPLVAVHAWADARIGHGSRASGFRDRDAAGEHGQRVLAERLAGWQEKYPDVSVERILVQDGARQQLLEWSASALLVVVGSHGRGGFAGLLLGSTSQALIHHARCPVVIVRQPRATEREPRTPS